MSDDSIQDVVDGGRILAVDDDAAHLEKVSNILVAQGYAVDTATNAAQARDLASKNAYDLFLVDLIMPGTGGKVLCREFRATSRGGVIMVSSISDDEERFGLLEMGADDYIVKPFVDRELLARIRAVLRRVRTDKQRAPHTARFGDWELTDGERRLSHKDGRVITLTTSEAEVLRFFVANPDVACSREDILAISRMRQHGGAGDRSVDALIVRLRKKIEPDPHAPTYIETVWGRGYRFTAAPA